MWTKTRLLMLLIGNHPGISRELRSFWALPTTTTDSSLILLRWLPPLVTCYLIRKNSSGLMSSSDFETLKQLLTSAPVLKLPDYSKPFRIGLAADASDVAVGAELSQNGQPVAFYSKKITPTEARYHVTDHELLAIYQACMKWRQYLHGHRCTIYTDHKPHTYLYTQPYLNARQAQWLEHLAELDLQTIYRPGLQNTIADALSRYGQCIEGDSIVVASHSLNDERVQQLVKTWLSVVAPHVDYYQCCETAKVGLASGNDLASFPCQKCGAVCYDPDERASRLQTQHRCVLCGHKWSKYPLVLVNPLAVLKFQLRGSNLFVSTLPVDSSTLGVADHHSRCCQDADSHVFTAGDHA